MATKQVILYFENDHDAMNFTLAASSVIGSEGPSREDLRQEVRRATRILVEDLAVKPTAFVFRCSELGHDCAWECRADAEEELWKEIEKHGREEHDSVLDQSARDRLKGVIHKNAA